MMKYFYSSLFILLCTLLVGQNGVLDPNFGNNGTVIFDVNNADNASRAITIQSDEKILLGGYATLENNVFNVVRLLPDGTPDPDFGDDGVVNTPFSSASIASALAIQDDGKIIAGGHSWNGQQNVFTVVRYLSDGALDVTFGDSGIVTTTLEDRSGFGKALAIYDDGKIILAGMAYTAFSDLDDFVLVRYQPDGRIDSTFGSNGIVFTTFGNARDWIHSVKIQNDGKILAGGFSDFRMAMARYLEDGSLDLSFGTDGRVTTQITSASTDAINSLALSDVGIFTCGVSIDTHARCALLKYTYDGSLDSDFGTGGIIINDIAQASLYKDIQLKGNKIIVGGSANTNGNYSYILSQFNLDGSPVMSFGTNGNFLVAPIDAFNQLEGIAIQDDGKILATGFCKDFPYDIGLVRVLSNTLVSVDEQTNESEVLLYPNPTTGLVYIRDGTLSSPDVIQLMDVSGKVVSEIQWTLQDQGLMIHLPGHPAGIYFLAIRQGDKTSVHKIVKK
jgi:uncharacterized delta-60 repeat protein